MSSANKIKVNKDIYIWAIEESQIAYDEIKFRFHKIEEWISQDSYPTFRQLEDLASFLKVPFGYMFLENPPKTNIINSEFRTIGNKMPQVSKNLQDTLYSMGEKKEWLSEYRKKNGWEKIIPGNYKDINRKDIYSVSNLAKEFLQLKGYWYREIKEARMAFNYLRNVLESVGIIVMKNGIVGNNTSRNLNLDEFRGFLLYDEYSPLIFINSKDSYNGMIFTLIHEFIHLLLQEDDIFIDEHFHNDFKEEQRINSITAEFLIPASHIDELWNNNKDELEQIEEFGKTFHVSKIAVAIKLNQMNKISDYIVEEVKQRTTIELNNKAKKSGRGDFYNNTKSRYSDSFARNVVQGAESGEISYTYAFGLLDGSIKAYDYFKEEIAKYG